MQPRLDTAQSTQDPARIRALAELFRANDPDFARWAAGYGVVRHADLTQLRVRQMVDELLSLACVPSAAVAYQRLQAADRLACAGMWLVAHMTYARRVRLDGAPLEADDFKEDPEGHTGGALNMVPAYTGYLLMNVLDGVTRAWMMGQGHCVAAIDAMNVLVDNMSPAHAARYGLDDVRLTRFVNDFYLRELGPDGTPVSPLGSHVNAHTAGGTQEGGYLGFTELQYAHAPLPGERLVAFLSDGAFEEQRGSDWAPRWWRAEDSGLVAPIMILNGRRIEERSQIEQQGGESWLHQHLRLNGFEPIALDGRDPASIAWGIHVIEERLRVDVSQAGSMPGNGVDQPLRYGIAETVKGYGFPGAGTNAAHNLPLPGHPRNDAAARQLFNEGCAALHVPAEELHRSIDALATHAAQSRPHERDHWLATRQVELPRIPLPQWLPMDEMASPMAALDAQFVAIVEANPQLRPRVGNPDELRSNRLDRTLDTLKHRVVNPEPGIAESRTGAVITALNEEAVVCAALGNKAGLNLVVTYEAFAPKMLGALRQELIFSRHLARAGRPPGWLSVPLVLTSHTWENAKNEQSHQDPTASEMLMGEMADVAGVVYPPDANSAVASMLAAYRTRGRVVAMVVPKRPVVNRFSPEQAEALATDGVLRLDGDPHNADVLLASVGAYQMQAAWQAAGRLRQRGLRAALVVIGEPGRLRNPRDAIEAAYVLDDVALARWFPAMVPRVFAVHTRPEVLQGILRRVDTGPGSTVTLGYINHGGTLNVPELMFANRCSWAHVVDACAGVLDIARERVLDPAEIDAIDGHGDPRVVTRA